MTLNDLYDILKTTELPVAYNFFPDDEKVAPPCITYAAAYSENFGADNKVYSPITAVDVFLFERTMGTESVLEDVLDNAGIYWEKTITWENDEKVYQIIYEVKINGK